MLNIGEYKSRHFIMNDSSMTSLPSTTNCFNSTRANKMAHRSAQKPKFKRNVLGVADEIELID